MSSPYLYTPTSSQPPELSPSPYLYQYYNQPRISPYIPTVPLDMSGPNTPNRTPRILDDDRWAPPHPRQRRPSWHAGMSTPASLGIRPGFGGSPNAFDNLALPDDYRSGRPRSFDGRNYQRPSGYYDYPVEDDPWMSPGYPYHTHSRIHPLLKGGSRYVPILFDLSSPSFDPQEIVGPGRTHSISRQILAQPATDPAITRLVITCDAVPQWPIYLDYNAAAGGYVSPRDMSPITVGDVLYAIHTSFQTQISHMDWARLNDMEETAIARAYTRRYKSFASMEQLLASQGVRRVDYLLKTFMFAGLVHASGDDGYENLKLLVTSR